MRNSQFNLRLSESDTSAEERQSLLESSKVKRLRRIMLISASCLSIGSHFGSHILGPLHRQFGSDTMFSILLSSFQLLNTVTSLGGFAVPRFGVARAGLFCTGIVTIGQAIVWANTRAENVWGMMMGLLIFGIGISPLAVVQESIIVKHFSTPSNTSGKPRVALTVALALLAGKFSGFIAGSSSSPLSTRFGHSTPFLAAFILCLTSFIACIIYLRAERKYERLTHGMLDVRAMSEHHHHARGFKWSELQYFGDAFWGYIAICWIFGAFMYPFLHLCPEIVQTLYDTTSNEAGATASMTLFTSVILYPLVGRWLDSHPTHLPIFFSLGSCLQLAGLSILLSPFLRVFFGRWVAITTVALGIGFGPLLLVVACARVVDVKWVSIGLGIHKSLEMSGSTVIQSISGRMLESSDSSTPKHGVLNVLFLLFLLTVLHLGAIFIFTKTLTQRQLSQTSYAAIAKDESELEEDEENETDQRIEPQIVAKHDIGVRRKGRLAIGLFSFAIFAAWTSFILNVQAERGTR